MIIYDFPKPTPDLPKKEPVCYGGNFSVDCLMSAYKKALFPWFCINDKPLWFCPDPRCILYPNSVKLHKSIKPFIKKYKVKLDQNFGNFIKFCKNHREKSEETWIDENFIKGYTKLHEENIAHSVEIYENDTLIGGLYGLIIGKVFCGESMVSAKPNASKVALIKLCEILEPFGFIIDCQISNPHLKFMGAIDISRSKYIEIFNLLKDQDSGFYNFKELL